MTGDAPAPGSLSSWVVPANRAHRDRHYLDGPLLRAMTEKSETRNFFGCFAPSFMTDCAASKTRRLTKDGICPMTNMEIGAYKIDDITGVDVTEDGLHALFRFRIGDTETVFAFPFRMLMPMMQSVSAGFTKCLQVLDADPNTKHVLPCENCTITPSPDFQHMIFSFQLPGGMEMSYPVPRTHAAKMRNAMSIFMQDPGKIPMGKVQ
jgi:hypothetical protein